MMQNASRMIAERLLSWPEVTRRPHRFGGIEFLYRGTEIGHVHGDHLVDLLFSKPIRDQLVGSGRAQPHHMFPESGWVSVFLSTKEDVANAIELLRLKYDELVKRETNP
jgi:hypothetical protein